MKSFTACLLLPSLALVACGEVVSVGGPQAVDAGTDHDKAEPPTDASTKPEVGPCTPEMPDGCPVTPPPVVSSGIILASCAPADGPALDFFFSKEEGCGMSPGGGATGADSVDIQIYEELSGPTTVSFSADGVSGKGVASACVAGKCQNAVHVRLTLTTFDFAAGATAQGSYSLELKDGTRLSATFTSVVCRSAAVCG